MTLTPTIARPVGHLCDMACEMAVSPVRTCTCLCDGEHHGRGRIVRPGAVTPARDPFAGLPVIDDEPF